MAEGKKRAGVYLPSLRRCTRVRRSILRCFFLDMRLRRFLMTEPIGRPRFALSESWSQLGRPGRAPSLSVPHRRLHRRTVAALTGPDTNGPILAVETP